MRVVVNASEKKFEGEKKWIRDKEKKETKVEKKIWEGWGREKEGDIGNKKKNRTRGRQQKR